MPSGRRYRTDVRIQHGAGDDTAKYHHQRRSIDATGEKSFSDGLLTLPGYRFEKCVSFGDPGTPRLFAEGVKLHGRIEVSVIAKIGLMKGISGIEREAHILHALSKSHEGRTRILQLIEVVEISPVAGGVRVLILKHPGRNALTEYFHSNVRTTFLLPSLVHENPDGRPQGVAEMGQGDSKVTPTAGGLRPQAIDSPKRAADTAPKDMDLSTFLHFAIQATQCLEVLHNSYGTHGDIRPQAFHWQSDDVIRFAHFGQRTTYLDMFRGTAAAILETERMSVEDQKIIEGIATYMAPEELGRQTIRDHRTDLYGLGALFWRLIAGYRMFSGSLRNIIHRVATEEPALLHIVRPDVPVVLSKIVHKLLAKDPDHRYASVTGLKEDLLECNSLLGQGWSTQSGNIELIKDFPLARHDRSSILQLGTKLYGRDTERDTLQHFIQDFAGHYTPKDVSSSTSQGSSDTNQTGKIGYRGEDNGIRVCIMRGPAGSGKTSVLARHIEEIEKIALFGQAKFTEGDATPYSAILSCISDMIRRILIRSPSEVRAHAKSLIEHLGPQIHNISLLSSTVPEILDFLGSAWEGKNALTNSTEPLGTTEARSRFENLIVEILSQLSAKEMVVFLLDDFQNADASSLSLLEALAHAQAPIMILGTVRSSNVAITDRLAEIFGPSVFVSIQPLDKEALSDLVCGTLRIDSQTAAPLVSVLASHSYGNAFTARSLLLLLKNEGYLVFDWSDDCWKFDIASVNDFIERRSRINPEDVDTNFILQRLFRFSTSVQRFLAVAAAIGPTFDVTIVADFMNNSDTGDRDSMSDSRSENELSHGWIPGLQIALSEAMISSYGHDLYTFTHDRYREASLVLAESQPGGLSGISSKLVDILLEDSNRRDRDKFVISDYILRCVPVLRRRSNRGMYVETLMSTGAESLAQGAPESAVIYYESAYELLSVDDTKDFGPDAAKVIMHLAELSNWKGEISKSNKYLDLLEKHDLDLAQRVFAKQVRARNLFTIRDYAVALKLLFEALHYVGINFKTEYSDAEIKARYEETRTALLHFGIEKLKQRPITTDESSNLQNILLSELFLTAYFTTQAITQIASCETISLALRHGLSPNNIHCFVNFAAMAADMGDFGLGKQVAALALDVARRIGTSLEKGRVFLYYCAFWLPVDDAHYSQIWKLADETYKFAQAGGDPATASFASCHLLSQELFLTKSLPDALEHAENVLTRLDHTPKHSTVMICLYTIRNLARALTGGTYASSADSIYDAPDWNDKEYLAVVGTITGSSNKYMNWYESYRLCALYCFGFNEAAVATGEFAISTSHQHPNHRHNQLAVFYSGLALCAVARSERSVEQRRMYILKVRRNLELLFKYYQAAPINHAHWYYLLRAELMDLEKLPDAMQEYDRAIAAAEQGEWWFDYGWASILAGSHMSRRGIKTFARSLFRQGLTRLSTIGATSVVRRLEKLLESDQPELYIHSNPGTRDAGIQTDINQTVSINVSVAPQASPPKVARSIDPGSISPSSDSIERTVQRMSPKDLAALISSLQATATENNLRSSLERLTDLMIYTTASVTEHACIIARDDESNDFRVFTHQQRGKPCQIFDPPTTIRDCGLGNDVLNTSVVETALHTSEVMIIPYTDIDPRFFSILGGDVRSDRVKSMAVVPVRSKGVTLGAILVASLRPNAFSEDEILVLNLLATQAAVLISNGILFNSLRKSTQANLRALAEQRQALEAARKSQEEALQATRVKSIFLANMSHEMRTPFASFYGLLGLLAETELNAEQRDLVNTARQSCELLLETISALLDFSKLEAHAVNLVTAPVSLADVLADCQALLLTFATEKDLALTYNIDPDVPFIVEADGPRLRQILQNLLGNALKFTTKGSVGAKISLDHSTPVPDEMDVWIRIDVMDTGIGMRKQDMVHLFQPFRQIDQSVTKQHGGTGLGLSICKELLHLMGGTINVTSTPGEGSCFTCRIPVKICVQLPPRLSQQRSEITSLRDALAARSPRIFACSPFELTKSLLSTFLAKTNFSIVSEVEEFNATLARLKSKDPKKRKPQVPDIAILDVPPADIDAIVEKMDEIPELVDIPIIHIFARTGVSRLTQQQKQKYASIEPDSAADEKPLLLSPSARRVVVNYHKPLRLLPFLRILLNAVQGHDSGVPLTELGLIAQVLPPEPSESSRSGEQDSSGYLTAASSPALKPKKSFSKAPSPTPSPKVPGIRDNFSSDELATLSTTRVLIAEDNKIAQQLLCRQLSNLGFQVTATSNGSEAVEQWQAHPPGYFKVALFDHHMPVCDGLTAARRIRGIEAQKGVELALPLISLTADAQSQAKDDCLEAGMQWYFTKPLRPDDLIHLVRTYVLGPTMVSSSLASASIAS